MPKNGFVMRFFGYARRGVGVVGAERSIQLSYGRITYLLSYHIFSFLQVPGGVFPHLLVFFLSIAPFCLLLFYIKYAIIWLPGTQVLPGEPFNRFAEMGCMV